MAYSKGLRFNELRHLQTVDFAANPHARKFSVCKSRKGFPPKPRSVLTVFDWTAGVLISLQHEEASPRVCRTRRRQHSGRGSLADDIAC
ncbi:hypothetical protein [Pseudarthrobacter sulfonivorans]|uniref:hypothetical protein n=1 Tax=Pseudarthrobacter sulfonivorans TaxID=121292 RepID=UPI0031D6CB18